ncbi:hypothetical protein TUSST3_45910 [Streptomyces sp. TUS-ST3]|uniref:eCIS core domain-containing protein n=1 Tax=Streptomyces sp. TUS-ST3 TaxID=3025591 RepID=UPI00235B4150|nr:DUF4157 domain-containing protein [Streptomyces sp. TUS-ST3]GLP67969.1 hypothetical protein TUSST3_45910 [Streptomyces sp. TUS-ST3]
MFQQGGSKRSATGPMRAREPRTEKTGSAGGGSLWQELAIGSNASQAMDRAGSAWPLHVQPKLTMSTPDDPLEQEADRSAERAASTEIRSAVQPVSVLSHAAVPGVRTKPTTQLDSRIASTSGGRPLPGKLRRDMEAAFDVDLSAVRLHDTQQERTDVESIGARAFTHKHHIWLGREVRDDDRDLMAHELTHVIQQGTTARRPKRSESQARPDVTADSRAPNIQEAWYNVSIPFTEYEFDPSWSGVKTAVGLVKDVAVDVGHGIGTAAEKALDVGKVLWQVTKVLYNGAVHALIMLIEAPGKALEYIKEFVAGLVAKAPGKLQEVLAEHLAPRLGGPADTPAGAVASIQNKEEPTTATEPVPETRWQAVMRHLGVRVGYLKDNWWQVIKDAALEILVPGVALYRHFPTMIEELSEAYRNLMAGEYSSSFDHLLATARAAMAIVSSFMAQVSIAAFIIGSIIGTPIVGVAALETIGLVVITADASIQLLSLGQSIDNLDRPRSPEQHETDYGLIADSSIALAILLALLALGAITSAAVEALLRRFPGITATFESARTRIRARLGRGAKVPESPKPSELRAVEATIQRVPAASEYPVRASLTTEQQLAFDRWIAERIKEGLADGRSLGDIRAHNDAALAGKDPAAVARMLKQRQIPWVQEQEAQARRANTLREGNPLDPKRANGPVDRGGDVSIRWDKTEPSEIAQAQRLAERTGEHVELFGDNYEGIDGTIGKPPRPLQLKADPAADANPAEMAQKALKNAKGAPYTRVEVSIEAPAVTRAQARKAFSRVNPKTITDGTSVSRVRVWCKDGVYEPTSFTPVPIPPHLDDPDGQSP